MGLGRYELAGWWERVGAAFADGLAVNLLSLVVSALVGALTGVLVGVATGVGATPSSDRSVGLAVLAGAAVGFVAVQLYYALTMRRAGARNGASLGKQALMIRVVRDDGRRVGGWFAVGREIVKALVGVLTLGIDYLWPLWERENRALHDIICRTHVVRSAPSAAR